MPACALGCQIKLHVQWLGQLSKGEREEKLLEVMDYMADGTIKPPPPSKPFICSSDSHACSSLSCAVWAPKRMRSAQMRRSKRW